MNFFFFLFYILMIIRDSDIIMLRWKTLVISFFLHMLFFFSPFFLTIMYAFFHWGGLLDEDFQIFRLTRYRFFFFFLAN